MKIIRDYWDIAAIILVVVGCTWTYKSLTSARAAVDYEAHIEWAAEVESTSELPEGGMCAQLILPKSEHKHNICYKIYLHKKYTKGE